MEDNVGEDIDQLNLGEEEVKIDLYNENEMKIMKSVIP